MQIYVDVDGTLTRKDMRNSIDNAEPRQELIDKLLALVEEGHSLVLWSTRGRKYAQRAARKFGLPAVACCGKAHIIIDDKPHQLARRLKNRVMGVDEFMATNPQIDGDGSARLIVGETDAKEIAMWVDEQSRS